MSADTPDLDFDPPDALAGLSIRCDGILARLCDCGCGQTLTGRQKRFASRLCCSRWWDTEHPRIGRGPEGPREGTIKALILGVLADGEWWTKRQIADAIRAFEHSVGSRISELQRAGHRIETDARLGCSTRAHRFRLVRG